MQGLVGLRCIGTWWGAVTGSEQALFYGYEGTYGSSQVRAPTAAARRFWAGFHGPGSAVPVQTAIWSNSYSRPAENSLGLPRGHARRGGPTRPARATRQADQTGMRDAAGRPDRHAPDSTACRVSISIVC